MILEVKQMLWNLSIAHGGLSEPHLTVSDPSRKYFEICLKVDDANKLDKALKSDTSLIWLLVYSHQMTSACPTYVTNAPSPSC